MKLLTLILSLFLIVNYSLSQVRTQNIRGKVVDIDTKTPLIGAKVKILNSTDKLYAAACNYNGDYTIYNVPIGKHELEFSFMSYSSKVVTVIVNSGKEPIINIEMEETGIIGKEIVVTLREKGEAINEMATVSAQSFSIAETNRYAGSRGDPARMMSNFAGAQGTDDSRNDLVIRGNSPAGILYKVEGIDIPNPNHFAISGSGGGPVSILNNKFLSNSDFFMSAFPAEYGNSTSGVFDLKLRNGNNNLHEFSGQFGFLGIEAQVEGPISKKSGSSYLIGGRYSTFSLLKSMGISIGTDAVPVYGDGAFKFNFPLKKGGSLALFGMGGASEIAIVISDQKTPAQDAFGDQDRDQYFGTSMYVGGLIYKKPISSKAFIKSTLAISQESQHAYHDYIDRDLNTDSTYTYNAKPHNMMGYVFDINKAMAYFSVNYKINKQHLIKYGVNADIYGFKMLDSVKTDITDVNASSIIRWDYISTSPEILLQPFIQWRYKLSKKLIVNAGLHSQYFSVSNSLSAIEPRIGVKYNLNGNNTLAFGSGLHSQTQPMYTYFYHKLDQNNEKVYHNKDMGFSKSIHTVLSYNLKLNKSMKFKTEAYFQHLYEVPVEVQSSAFSLVNQGSGFARFFPDSLKNTGTAQNYGIEFTLEKFFAKSFFFMSSVSLYQSTYKGSDNIERSTDYNGNYIINGLFGKEFTLGKKGNQTLSLGVKITYAGGKRYSYVDTVATNAQKEIIFLDEGYNTIRFRDYFRLDFKINYVLNTAKVTHEFGLDIINATMYENAAGLTYVPNPNKPSEPYQTRKQLGFLPLFYYKIDFKVGGKRNISLPLEND